MLYGIPCATQDVDLVAELRAEHAEPFAARTREAFYVVLSVQRGLLDDAYMDRWAGDLGVADLLQRARHGGSGT